MGESINVGAESGPAIWKVTKTDDGILRGYVGRNEVSGASHTLCWNCENTDQDRCSWFNYPPVMPKGNEYLIKPMADCYLFLVTKCKRYKASAHAVKTATPMPSAKRPNLFKGEDTFRLDRKAKGHCSSVLSTRFCDCVGRLLINEDWTVTEAASFFDVSPQTIRDIVLFEKETLNIEAYNAIAKFMNEEIRRQNPCGNTFPNIQTGRAATR